MINYQGLSYRENVKDYYAKSVFLSEEAKSHISKMIHSKAKLSIRKTLSTKEDRTTNERTSVYADCMCILNDKGHQFIKITELRDQYFLIEQPHFSSTRRRMSGESNPDTFLEDNIVIDGKDGLTEYLNWLNPRLDEKL